MPKTLKEIEEMYARGERPKDTDLPRIPFRLEDDEGFTEAERTSFTRAEQKRIAKAELDKKVAANRRAAGGGRWWRPTTIGRHAAEFVKECLEDGIPDTPEFAAIMERAALRLLKKRDTHHRWMAKKEERETERAEERAARAKYNPGLVRPVGRPRGPARNPPNLPPIEFDLDAED